MDVKDDGKKSDNYNITVDQYYTMSMTVAEHYHISPLEIYDSWELPMMLVTFVYIHNQKITDIAMEQQAAQQKKPKPFHASEHYIYNVRLDDIVEETPEDDARTLLKDLYRS